MKRALFVVFFAMACDPSQDATLAAVGSTGALEEGSTGSAEDDFGSDGMESAGFIEDPNAPGDGEETAGGEGHSGRWHSACFTTDAEFTSCETWCQQTDFGSCLYVEVSSDGCAPAGEGTNVLGWCHRNPFAEWPADVASELRIRCACSL